MHGRSRDHGRGDEQYFGPYVRMLRASLEEPRPDAQWSGLTTRIAERMLDTGMVEAILTVAPDPDDRWKPVPVLVTDSGGLANCRGMRMGYAPLLALLEPARARGFRRLGVIGIPCQVHALRALEAELGFEQIYVIGTPCSDNTTTARFHEFLGLLSGRPETITYVEFRPDYRVELRFGDGSKRLIPFLDLPLSQLPADFFPLTCRTCVDYTNALADLTIGYMGGAGEQWVLLRNTRGVALFDLIADEVACRVPTSAGRRRGAVRGYLANLQRAGGGLPVRRMPRWLRPLVSWLMPRIGPRGIEFARARVEMKAIECVLGLRRAHSRRMRHMIPAHIWALVRPYGLKPKPGELP